jgi:hypothetical protein
MQAIKNPAEARFQNLFDKGFSSLPSWRSSAKHEWIIHFSGPFSTPS